MTLPISLLTAAAAVVINVWLGFRIASLRHLHKVSVGDGGNDALLRRMRAQANFIENAPFFMILLVVLELAGVNRPFIAAIAAVFLAARVAHGLGMDGGDAQRWRAVGMMGQTLALGALAIYAVIKAVAAL